LKHVEQLSDEINCVTCASSWDLYTRITTVTDKDGALTWPWIKELV